MEQEREEALSKQAVLQVQKYEGGKSNVDEIIQKALKIIFCTDKLCKAINPFTQIRSFAGNDNFFTPAASASMVRYL